MRKLFQPIPASLPGQAPALSTARSLPEDPAGLPGRRESWGARAVPWAGQICGVSGGPQRPGGTSTDGPVPPPDTTASGHSIPGKRTESYPTALPTSSTEHKTTLVGAEENATSQESQLLNTCLLGSCSLMSAAPGTENADVNPAGSPPARGQTGRAAVTQSAPAPRRMPNSRGTKRARHGQAVGQPEEERLL